SIPMPPVTRNRSSASTAPSRASTASGAVRKAKVTVPPAVSRESASAPEADKKEEEEEGTCCICLDGLSAKRTTKLLPCNHVLHRTCALQLTETRLCPCGQRCPMCRGGVRQMLDLYGGEARSDPHYFETFGSIAQPSMGFIFKEAEKYTDSKKSLIVQFFQQKTREDMAIVGKHMQQATQSKAGMEFKKDIREELKKLRRRARIYEDMLSLKGFDRADDTPLEYEEWNKAREKRLMKMRLRHMDAREAGEESNVFEEMPRGPATRTRSALAHYAVRGYEVD
ncbi:hypothetical protein PMAYCL1PPCAC_10832, partial [Pristionchus mayeri]